MDDPSSGLSTSAKSTTLIESTAIQIPETSISPNPSLEQLRKRSSTLTSPDSKDPKIIKSEKVKLTGMKNKSSSLNGRIKSWATEKLQFIYK
jgi:hypothetical protein